MVLSAGSVYTAQQLEDASRPRVLVEIVLSGSTEYESDLTEDRRILTTGRIDRLKDKEASRGVSFAGQVVLTLDNGDGDLTQDGGGTYDEGLMGKTVTIYSYFALNDNDELFLADDFYLGDEVYLTDGMTALVQQFKGIVDRARRTGPQRRMQLTLMDSLRDLSAATFAADGSYTGLSVDVIKELIDSHTSLTPNTAAHARALEFAVGTSMKVTWSSGDKVLDAIKQVHQAFGTSCWSDEIDEIHIDMMPARFGGFLDIKRQLEVLSFMYNGDENTRPDGWNLKSITPEKLASQTYNQISLQYVNRDTGATETVTENDTTSQAQPWGTIPLSFTTTAEITPAQARIWPRRLLTRFGSVPVDFITQAQATLRKAVLNQTSDVIIVTDPATGLSLTTWEITRIGKALTACQIDFEADPYDNEKWARAGTDDAGDLGTDRPSDKIDYIKNKSFEVAVNAGVDDTPLFWSLDSGSGGTFEITTDEARDTTIGKKSLHIVSAADSSIFSQVLDFAGLLNGVDYMLRVFYKGTITSGTPTFKVLDSTTATLVTRTITTTKADWFDLQLVAALTMNANTPASLEFDMNGATFDIYVDDIQIDVTSAKAYQENWSLFGYASEDDGEAAPGFDADGNANGAINEAYAEGLEKHTPAF